MAVAKCCRTVAASAASGSGAARAADAGVLLGLVELAL